MATAYTVTGPLVVLATSAGGEQYLYKGATISDGFTEASIEHALSVGLIAEVELEATDTSAGDPDTPPERPTPTWNHEQIDAWAARQEPPIEFTSTDPAKPATKAEKLEQITAELDRRTSAEQQ